MDKQDIKQAAPCFRQRLECKIAEYMDMSVTERSAVAIKTLLECLDMVRHFEAAMDHPAALGAEEAQKWVCGMKNADGTTGPHWTMAQTTAAVRAAGNPLETISETDFWAAMNMMWSDYSRVAEKFSVNRPDFYAELAKAFLCDKDGPAPGEKLARYYRRVILSAQ